jgi:hypothetical protein
MNRIAVASELVVIAELLSTEPWNPAVAKSWADYVSNPLTIVVKDTDSLKKSLRSLSDSRGDPAACLRNMSNMQELLDEVIEQANFAKTRIYGAMDHAAKFIKE